MTAHDFWDLLASRITSIDFWLRLVAVFAMVTVAAAVIVSDLAHDRRSHTADMLSDITTQAD